MGHPITTCILGSSLRFDIGRGRWPWACSWQYLDYLFWKEHVSLNTGFLTFGVWTLVGLIVGITTKVFGPYSEQVILAYHWSRLITWLWAAVGGYHPQRNGGDPLHLACGQQEDHQWSEEQAVTSPEPQLQSSGWWWHMDWAMRDITFRNVTFNEICQA